MIITIVKIVIKCGNAEMLAFRYLKSGFRIFFILYIYLFTFERFVKLLLLLLVIWLVKLKLRFYDKIFINIFFYLKSKMKAEILGFRRFKDKCCRLYLSLLIMRKFMILLLLLLIKWTIKLKLRFYDKMCVS